MYSLIFKVLQLALAKTSPTPPLASPLLLTSTVAQFASTEYRLYLCTSRTQPASG